MAHVFDVSVIAAENNLRIVRTPGQHRTREGVECLQLVHCTFEVASMSGFVREVVLEEEQVVPLSHIPQNLRGFFRGALRDICADMTCSRRQDVVRQCQALTRIQESSQRNAPCLHGQRAGGRSRSFQSRRRHQTFIRRIRPVESLEEAFPVNRRLVPDTRSLIARSPPVPQSVNDR